MASATTIASNNQKQIDQNGNALKQQFQQYGADNAGGAPVNTVASTANYLNGIEAPIAAGQGGYNADETAAIQGNTGPTGLNNLYDPSKVSPSADYLAGQQLTPEAQQQMVTSAGISAGAGNAAAQGAAQRSFAATGGNPAAEAAYKARAADSEGSQAGDAMTSARLAASNAAATRAAGAEATREAGGAASYNEGMGVNNAASSRAATIGNTRLDQQQKGLQYYQGQNAQANSNQQQAQQLQGQEYATQTAGDNGAANTALSASQTPSTFDKIIGGVSGAASAFLADGDYMGGGTDAVVGENGPEKIVKMMDDGGGPYMPPGMDIPSSDRQQMPDSLALDIPSSNRQQIPGQKPPAGVPFWQNLAIDAKQQIGQAQNGTGSRQAAPAWNKATPYSQLGSAIGKSASYLDDGDMMIGTPASTSNYLQSEPQALSMAESGIISKPTKMKLEPGEAVVPLNYRANAKIRPSAAMNMPKANIRSAYGARA